MANLNSSPPSHLCGNGKWAYCDMCGVNHQIMHAVGGAKKDEPEIKSPKSESVKFFVEEKVQKVVTFGYMNEGLRIWLSGKTLEFTRNDTKEAVLWLTQSTGDMVSVQLMADAKRYQINIPHQTRQNKGLTATLSADDADILLQALKWAVAKWKDDGSPGDPFNDKYVPTGAKTVDF